MNNQDSSNQDSSNQDSSNPGASHPDLSHSDLSHSGLSHSGLSHPDLSQLNLSQLDLSQLEKHAAEFVTQLYGSRDVPHYPYHNLKHTAGVVTHVREIAAHYRPGPAENFVLVVAAWFHNIGHLYGPMAGHEERGVTIMQKHLCTLPEEVLASIAACIMATRLPARPGDLMEKILCDADTYHLGTTYFLQTDPLVRQEVEMRTGRPIPNWWLRTLDMLRQHAFFTDYCQALLREGKARNVAWVEAQIQA